MHLYAVTVVGVCQMTGSAAQGNLSRTEIHDNPAVAGEAWLSFEERRSSGSQVAWTHNPAMAETGCPKYTATQRFLAELAKKLGWDGQKTPEETAQKVGTLEQAIRALDERLNQLEELIRAMTAPQHAAPRPQLSNGRKAEIRHYTNMLKCHVCHKQFRVGAVEALMSHTHDAHGNTGGWNEFQAAHDFLWPAVPEHLRTPTVCTAAGPSEVEVAYGVTAWPIVPESWIH